MTTLSQFKATTPTQTILTNPIYTFTISSATANVGATYTNNGHVWQLLYSISSSTTAVLISITGGAPTSSGTLAGICRDTGANLTFSSVSLTSGAASGTYTTPTGAIRLRLRMVGGGGGSSGSGTSGMGAGVSGGNTTINSTLLIAYGGQAATSAVATPAYGGGFLIGNGPIGFGIAGGQGGVGGYSASSGAMWPGGAGGNSPFGGGGGTTVGAFSGGNGSANTGGGGGGASGGAGTTNLFCGGGGSAGGYIDCVISNPSSSYTYAVGSGGYGGGAGGSGYNGGNGGSGIIIIEEYYN